VNIDFGPFRRLVLFPDLAGRDRANKCEQQHGKELAAHGNLRDYENSRFGSDDEVN
jgi:hypothetical protein